MLAVIPARGGSKGVPGKNIRSLNGMPLVAYTIKAARESDIFEKIMVSTDSREIADIALEYGAEIPFLRPGELSRDETASDDVMVHAIEWFHSKGITYSEVCKLQPTSPLRNAEHIRAAYELLRKKQADFVVSVCECEHSPLWAGLLGEDGSMETFLREDVKKSRRQELPTYYRLNGAIYMGRTEAFLKNGSFIGKNGYAYMMKQEDSIDIDSELDFKIAECIMQNQGEE